MYGTRNFRIQIGNLINRLFKYSIKFFLRNHFTEKIFEIDPREYIRLIVTAKKIRLFVNSCGEKICNVLGFFRTASDTFFIIENK